MRALVVPDLHGRWWLAQGLLEEAGVVDRHGKRTDWTDVCVIQLGDLANCVAADRDIDLRLLGHAEEWFDVLIVGNHEHPYFGGPIFTGFFDIPEIREAVRKLHWCGCFRIGETLITHAGITSSLALPQNARQAEAAINEAWASDPGRHPFFAQIGVTRGGWAGQGGLLWSDWAEKRELRGFSQIHGHTPVERGPKRRDEDDRFAINLDVGSGWPRTSVRRIVGLWVDESGAPGEYVEFEGDRP